MLSDNNLFLLEAVRCGYKFDTNDDIISHRGTKLKLTCVHGYPKFSMKVKGKIRNVMAHRLKAYYLYGEKMFAPGIQVRHLNENTSDWSNSNISLGTQSENKMDKPAKDRMRVAIIAAYYLRRFTDGEVAEIRKLNQHGISYRRLAKAYKTCKSTLSYIMNKKTYALVA